LQAFNACKNGAAQHRKSDTIHPRQSQHKRAASRYQPTAAPTVVGNFLTRPAAADDFAVFLHCIRATFIERQVFYCAALEKK
jgi:hypothetical protein